MLFILKLSQKLSTCCSEQLIVNRSQNLGSNPTAVTHLSMNRSPSELTRYPPSPRHPSVIRQPAPYMPVGWNWTNSMSWLGRPARVTMADPSPVHVWADVQLKYARPYPLKTSQMVYYDVTINSR